MSAIAHSWLMAVNGAVMVIVLLIGYIFKCDSFSHKCIHMNKQSKVHMSFPPKVKPSDKKNQ